MSGTWRFRRARDVIAACLLVLEPHLAPLATTGVSGACPQSTVSDVDDDAPNRAVIQVALWRVVLADRARVVRVIGHQPTQSAGVDAAPVALDQRFDAGLAQPGIEQVVIAVEVSHPGQSEMVGMREVSVATRAHSPTRTGNLDVV